MVKSVLTASSVTALTLVLGLPTASAQDGKSAGIEEVIVTAQRREQTLQDAAVPLQSFSQDSLTQSGMESAQDLGLLSPALGVSAGGGPLTSLFVRGVGALTVNPLTDAAVAQNIDGIYLGRSSGAAGQGLYDLERVELLKGPQGTLYGRNATGGVVNYIPNKPIIGENSGYFQAEAGNYSKVGVQGAANFGISENVAVRISGNKLERDGFSDDGTNDQDAYSLRGQVLFEPTEQLSIRVAADYTTMDNTGPGGDLIGSFANPPAGSITDFTPSGLPVFSGPTAPGANAIRQGVLHTPSFAFYQPLDVDDSYQDISWTGYMAEINYEMDAGTLTFLPSYRESTQDYQFFGPGFAPAKTNEENEQTSLELRFATDLDGPLNGIIGAFYIEEDITTKSVFAQNYASPLQNYDNGGDSSAIFGQLTFDVSDTFRLNAGVRYTEDSKFANGTSDTFLTFCGGAPASGNFLTPPASFGNGCAGGIPPHPVINDRDEFIQYFVDLGLIAAGSVADIPGMGPPPVYEILIPGGITPSIASIVNVGDGQLSSDLSYSETTYRFGVEWDWGEDNLLYATFENGYRAGGVDLSAAAPTYDPEYIDAYTIGSKNRFLDNTLQVNAELFLWEYQGQQVTYFTTLGGASSFPIANADATIQGLDLDMIWAATSDTTISMNLQFLDSTYDTLELISDPAVGRFGCESQGVAGGVESFDCSGQSLVYSPEFGADLSVNHVLHIGDYDLSLTASASHRGEQQTNFVFLDQTEADSYTMLNLDATLLEADGVWSVSAFARNVTDEQFLQNTNINNRGLTYGIYNPPKTYGLRLLINY